MGHGPQGKEVRHLPGNAVKCRTRFHRRVGPVGPRPPPKPVFPRPPPKPAFPRPPPKPAVSRPPPAAPLRRSIAAMSSLSDAENTRWRSQARACACMVTRFGLFGNWTVCRRPITAAPPLEDDGLATGTRPGVEGASATAAEVVLLMVVNAFRRSVVAFSGWNGGTRRGLSHTTSVAVR